MLRRLMHVTHRSKLAARAGLVLAALVLGAPAARAAQQAAPPQTLSLFDYIAMSGFIGWCICVLSVIALALVLENLLTLRRERLAPPELVEEVQNLFDEGLYQQALDLCERDRSFFARVCAAGIAKIGHKYELIERAVQEAGNEESIKLHQKVGWLSVIGALAPMFGLLGTVQGMIVAFQVVAHSQNPTPGQLAEGIYIKLLTTFEGLMVAIPVIAAFVWIRNRLVRAIMEVGAIVEDLFEKFRTEP